jgi:hypothetical protein
MLYGSAQRPVAASIDSETKRFGEEMIIQKLNKIFDDVKKDNREFSDGYHSLKKPSNVD